MAIPPSKRCCGMLGEGEGSPVIVLGRIRLQPHDSGPKVEPVPCQPDHLGLSPTGYARKDRWGAQRAINHASRSSFESGLARRSLRVSTRTVALLSLPGARATHAVTIP
jgi:hypothetical protein